MEEKIKTRTLRFPPKKTLIYGEGIVRLASCVTVWRQGKVSVDVLEQELLSPERHAPLYPFDKLITSLYFRSFVNPYQTKN